MADSTEETTVERLQDEFSSIAVKCPVCGEQATSVYKTGVKTFYNHGEPRVVSKGNQNVEMTWKSCETDRR